MAASRVEKQEKQLAEQSTLDDAVQNPLCASPSSAIAIHPTTPNTPNAIHLR